MPTERIKTYEYGSDAFWRANCWTKKSSSVAGPSRRPSHGKLPGTATDTIVRANCPQQWRFSGCTDLVAPVACVTFLERAGYLPAKLSCNRETILLYSVAGEVYSIM